MKLTVVEKAFQEANDKMLLRLSQEMDASRKEIATIQKDISQILTLMEPRQARKSRQGKNCSERDLRTAQFILDTIKLSIPKLKEPRISDWGNEVRLMREVDNITDQEIRDGIVAFSHDPFWSVTCQSVRNLRKNFTRARVIKAPTQQGESIDAYRQR